ncbi:hypothetical protein CDAR_537641 [Caerostris darwini]|uniref:Major facilitator superfamily (MFS) profile domain-containing protein n=1 Tax=Caerostris darwini TaxID=1538125 RepID=A0AAV4X1K5_9ARAC|nr:hypothetical protein CDAR_537641 [Caerostris darwini]
MGKCPNVIKRPDNKESSKNCCSIRKRYIVALLGFLGLACTYAMQTDLNMTILAMSYESRSFAKNQTKVYIECPMLVENDNKSKSSEFPGPRYNWSPKEQGVILSSFYYGYLLTLMPGGYLAQSFSAKWIFGLGIFLSALLSLLTPTAAAMGVMPVVAVRIMQGLSQGVTKPALYAIISRWSPKFERSRFSTFTMSGGLVGSVIALPLSGVISSCSSLGGWPTVFTLFGVLGCVWFVIWIYFTKDSPLDHPTISPLELQDFDQNIEETIKKIFMVSKQNLECLCDKLIMLANSKSLFSNSTSELLIHSLDPKIIITGMGRINQ